MLSVLNNETERFMLVSTERYGVGIIWCNCHTSSLLVRLKHVRLNVAVLYSKLEVLKAAVQNLDNIVLLLRIYSNSLRE